MNFKAVDAYIDLQNRKLKAAYNSRIDRAKLKLWRGDTVTFRCHFMQSTGIPNAPYEYVSLNVISAKLALGKIAAKPDSGTFKLDFEGDETANIDSNSSAQQVSDELNLLTSITNAGGVSVSGAQGGPWDVFFLQNGDRASIAGDGSLLSPLSFALVNTTVEGTANSKEVQRISLIRNTSAYANTFSEFPDASITVDELVAGEVGTNERQRITIDTPTVGGFFRLSFNGESSTAINYNADSAEVSAAIEGITGIGEGNVIITKSANFYEVEFIGTLAESDQPLLTADSSSLVVPIGIEMDLDLDQAGIDSLLGNDESAEATLELELQLSDGSTITPFAEKITVRHDLISGPLESPEKTESYYTKTEVDARLNNTVSILNEVTGLTGGGSANLDGVSTINGQVEIGQLILLPNVTSGVIEAYQVAAGAPAESDPQTIVPDDQAGVDELYFNFYGKFPLLNIDGELVGPVLHRADTFANLDALTIDLNEIVYASDTKGFYSGLAPASGIKPLGTNILEKTYAELTTLISASGLIPGQEYRLQFQTKWKQFGTGTITTYATEPLILKAATTTTFHQVARSETFPQDEIIYDFDDNVCEDGSTARDGWIIRRKDTIINLDVPCDFRHITFSLSKFDVASISDYSAAATYTKGDLTKLPSADVVIQAIKTISVAEPFNPLHWRVIIDSYSDSYTALYPAATGGNGYKTTGTPIEVTMFPDNGLQSASSSVVTFDYDDPDFRDIYLPTWQPQSVTGLGSLIDANYIGRKLPCLFIFPKNTIEYGYHNYATSTSTSFAHNKLTESSTTQKVQDFRIGSIENAAAPLGIIAGCKNIHIGSFSDNPRGVTNYSGGGGTKIFNCSGLTINALRECRLVGCTGMTLPRCHNTYMNDCFSINIAMIINADLTDCNYLTGGYFRGIIVTAQHVHFIGRIDSTSSTPTDFLDPSNFSGDESQTILRRPDGTFVVQSIDNTNTPTYNTLT